MPPLMREQRWENRGGAGFGLCTAHAVRDRTSSASARRKRVFMGQSVLLLVVAYYRPEVCEFASAGAATNVCRSRGEGSRRRRAECIATLDIAGSEARPEPARACFCKASSPTCAAALSTASTSPACSQFNCAGRRCTMQSPKGTATCGGGEMSSQTASPAAPPAHLPHW